MLIKRFKGPICFMFCCCVVLLVMGLSDPMSDPNIDYYSSVNMYWVHECPALMYCGCSCIEIPMDLSFMKVIQIPHSRV